MSRSPNSSSSKPREIIVKPCRADHFARNRDAQPTPRPATRQRDATLQSSDLFLDMLGGRTRRGRQHARCLSAATSLISPSHLGGSGRSVPMPPPTTCAAIWATLARARLQGRVGWRGICRRVRQLYPFLYAEGKRSDDPAAVLEGPKRGRALPKVLSIAEVDGLLTQRTPGRRRRSAGACRASARRAAAIA